MSEKRQLPKFATEAEEADWWASHQELIADWFEAATQAGTLGHGTAARQARERLNEGSNETSVTGERTRL